MPLRKNDITGKLHGNFGLPVGDTLYKTRQHFPPETDVFYRVLEPGKIRQRSDGTRILVGVSFEFLGDDFYTNEGAPTIEEYLDYASGNSDPE